MKTPGVAAEPTVETHLATARELLGLLAVEHGALLAADAVQLAKVCRDKTAALTRLCQLAPRLKNNGAATLPQQQRQQLAELLLGCQQQNLANRGLLEARAARARRTLGGIQGAQMAQAYDRRGRCGYSVSGRVRGCA